MEFPDLRLVKIGMGEKYQKFNISVEHVESKGYLISKWRYHWTQECYVWKADGSGEGNMGTISIWMIFKAGYIQRREK